MKVVRYEQNPLITPRDVRPHHDGFEVIGAFNAGVARYRDEILLVLRVAERPVQDAPGMVKVPLCDPETGRVEVLELDAADPRYDFSDPRVVRDVAEPVDFVYLTSISYLRVARSRDGRHFRVDDKPLVYPQGPLESFGIEDPRVTRIGDTYYIHYSAVSPVGIGAGLVSTQDFRAIRRHGLIFCPDNKDVAIFPEKIGGKYYALHRPMARSTGKPEIWIAESDNLLQWGNHRHLFGVRPGMWDSARIGGGTVPIRTDKGWLEFYHGATKDNRYAMGAVLLDPDDPARVIARSRTPVLEPEADYEKRGFFGEVVFSCGVLAEGDTIRMYYGVADTSMAGAELSLSEVLDSLEYLA